MSGHPCDVGDWSDTVSVSTNAENVVGLKSDGTIVMFGHVPGGYNLSQWTNVVDVFVGDESVSALNSDGTIMFAGALNGKILKYKTNEYKNEDIVSIIMG